MEESEVSLNMEAKTVDCEKVSELLKLFLNADEVGQERIYTTARVTHDIQVLLSNNVLAKANVQVKTEKGEITDDRTKSIR